MSFGPATTQRDIDGACYRIRQAGDALKHSCLLIADTNNDNDAALDGVVQLKYDAHCCYLIIDKATEELVVIDPHPALSARIENVVTCRDYKVKAVLSTVRYSITEAAELLGYFTKKSSNLMPLDGLRAITVAVTLFLPTLKLM